jgi:Mn2+/Fe2+ NRAMP family transporter
MTVTDLPVEPVAPPDGASAPEPGKKFSLLKIIGPGVVTGASDDDPSGIGTYSQAGAQLGFSVSWTMVLTFPLMVAIQEISARVGRTTGKGIASNIREHYPAWLLQVLVAMLFGANVINIGADLSAVGDALKLLIGGPGLLYVILFGIVCVVGPTFLDYKLYVRVLKWSCLSLFAYVAALATVKVPWGEALKGLVVPTVTWNAAYSRRWSQSPVRRYRPICSSGRRPKKLRMRGSSRSAKRCSAKAGKQAPRSQESGLILRSGWASPT